MKLINKLNNYYNSHACTRMEAHFDFLSAIRGYHIYKDRWTAVGEQLVCKRELGNSKDRYAVAVLKNDDIVGHLPVKISKICSIFLARRGSIVCVVSQPRRYSSDIPQGGLEIPCTIRFSGTKKEVKKLKRCLGQS